MYILQEAITFAIKHHGKQKYGKELYFYHLNKVQYVCLKFQLNERFPNILIETWLHDIIEDTQVTAFDIENIFGYNVAKIVKAVTDESGATRKERKAKTYIKIAAFRPEAVALKLADRIANIEYSKINNNKIYTMYQNEHIDFKKALYNKKDNLDNMWHYLENII